MLQDSRPDKDLQVAEILYALEPLFDVVREMARDVATLQASGRMTARRLAIQEAQLDLLQRRDEEVLFRKFVARYYSTELFAVRCQYETEVAKFQAFRRVLLDLICFLPDAERDRALTLLAGTPRRKGGAGLTVTL